MPNARPKMTALPPSAGGPGAPPPEPSGSEPTSERVEAALPQCVARLLNAAQEIDLRGSGEEALVDRLLGALLECEPGAAAGLVLRGAVRASDRIYVRASFELEQPVMPGERLFPALAEETVAPLPAPLRGSIHLAAPAFARLGAEPREWLLRHAALIVVAGLRSVQQQARVAELEQQVVQLEKLATLGQLAAGVVHELNNPLTAILAYSDYLAKRWQDRGAERTDVERLARINEAAGRIQQFSRELIEYSRPSGGLMGPVDLRHVLDRALSFCVHVSRRADVTVERSYRDIPLVEGMDSPLTQVFVNLITNALHAMSETGGTLTIRTVLEQERVVVSVADEGHGIDEALLPHIFDAYFTTKPKGLGTGLGLSIVRQIVGDHGGDIRVERREPRGTVFLVELPAPSRR